MRRLLSQASYARVWDGRTDLRQRLVLEERYLPIRWKDPKGPGWLL